MTDEEYDNAYEVGLKRGEKAFNAFVKKSTNVKALKEAGFTDDDLRKVRDVFMKHCAHGITMAEINNRDTEYNRFNNVSHKIQGFKKDKSTGEVINKGKYKTVEMDGINTISGMEFSCDQGFEITKPTKTKTKAIKPKNTNPSGIIGIKR